MKAMFVSNNKEIVVFEMSY